MSQRWSPHLSGRHGGNPGKAGSDIAVTKTHPIKSTLKALIDHICPPDKTNEKLLVSSLSTGCSTETAAIQFGWMHRHAIDKSTQLDRRLIQAFEPGELAAEQAYETGPQLAKEILGGKYEFVLITHIHIRTTSYACGRIQHER